jgi:hypothetical protein
MQSTRIFFKMLKFWRMSNLVALVFAPTTPKNLMR